MIDPYIIIRFACAFFSGVLLTWSGSLSQLSTRNLLASPTTLGIDAFAVLVLLTSSLLFKGFSSIIICFACLSLATLFLIFFLKRKPGFFNNSNIILLGICFNLFVAAIFSCLQFFMIAQGQEFPSELWFGQFRWADEKSLVILLVIFFLVLGFLIRLQKDLSIMSLGKSLTRHYNVDENKILLICMIITLWINTWIINFFGVFSFLGLLFPNIVRLVPYFRRSIRNELLMGPYWVALAFAAFDQLVYWVDYKGSEIPVGVICSVIGAIVLIFLILRQQALKERGNLLD